MPPPDPADAALLARLRAGDPLAPADLCTAFLDTLVAFLRRAFPRTDPDLVLTAAEDAVLSLVKKPDGYDATRNSLPGYLRMAARGDLSNLLQREARHQRNRGDSEIVEHAPAAGNEGADTGLPSFDDPLLAAVVAGFTAPERAFLDLLRAGENATAALAVALGLGDRPAAEQLGEVKRTRDRIIKRLQRAGEGP